jgi:toxin ParE1/3/4
LKERTVVLTREAEEELFDMYDWIASQASPAVAIAYVERLEDFLGRLGYGSHRGHQRNDIRPGLRIIGFERRVTVAFVVEDDRVIILRLFHRGRNWERSI